MRGRAGEIGIWGHALDLVGRGYWAAVWSAAVAIGFLIDGLSLFAVSWLLAFAISLIPYLIRWN